MTSVSSTEVQNDLTSFCDRAFHGEPIIISRPKKENVVIISEKEYGLVMANQHLQEIRRAKKAMREGRYQEYVDDKLKEAFDDIENGRIIDEDTFFTSLRIKHGL